MAVHEKLFRGTRNDSIVGKLETAMDEVGKLPKSVQKKVREIDGLIKELKVLEVLKVVLGQHFMTTEHTSGLRLMLPIMGI